MINIRPKLTVVVCLALIAVISVMVWTILRTNRLESAAQELALTVSEESFTADYPAALIDNLHPDYLAQISQRSLLRYLNNATQRLGPLDSLVSISGRLGHSPDAHRELDLPRRIMKSNSAFAIHPQAFSSKCFLLTTNGLYPGST